jgi:large subunit ribosomal protein L17
MRHRKRTCKLGRTSSHREAMMANMLKSLIENGELETTVPKAKELRRHADKMVTLAKKDTLASRRDAIAKLRVRYNPLTPKEARAVKAGEGDHLLNRDRKVIDILFSQLGPRFTERQGGYTRIVKNSYHRVGDAAQLCLIQYLEA